MSIIKSIKLSNTKYDLNDARISSNDITNWNGKTSNVGTVVGIQMNGGSTISPDSDGIIDLGTLITSHQSISGKADKVSNPTSGNFAGLDSNGNLTDSGSKASDFASSSDVTAIEEKIPTQASSSNLLADKNFVNSSISTATATFQGTYNLVNDLSLTTSATESGIVTALATEVSSADNNDYVFVLIPTADGTPTEISHVDRYKYNGTAWAYEYTLNNSSFTSAQWAAINSGITSSIVSAISDKYELPSGGIPATDLATAVLTSLGLADTAVQPSALNDYVTLATDLNITGVKTFLGLKKIAFKQATSSDKLGFTLFANDGTEKGYLEFNGSNKVDNIPLMTLGNYATAAAGLTQVGFRKYSSISGASGAYNLIAPLISDARTPFSLTTTYTNFYLPLGFTDGTTTVKTAKTGVVDLSSLLPDISGKADAATTLSGYGITDAKIENGVITLGSNSITPLTSHLDLTNYILKSNTAGLVKNDGTIDTSTYLTSAPVSSVNGQTGAVVLSTSDIGYAKEYFTIEALETTTVTFSRNAMYYSLNGGTWTSIAAGTASPSLSAGDKIRYKQTGLTPVTNYGIGTFSSTGNIKVYGNIMSLYYGDNFSGEVSLSGKNYAFNSLFDANTKLVDAENLILPATTLSNRCYYNMFSNNFSLVKGPKLLPATTVALYSYSAMFWGCEKLEYPPELPATTLAEGCYYQMFYNCTKLKVAPKLPATTLAVYCYFNMFYNCKNLTEAPELPATTITTDANYCYNYMFDGCEKLSYVKCSATTMTADSCTNYWLRGVSATGVFVKASGATWSSGVSGIPTGWTDGSESDYNVVRSYQIPSSIPDDSTLLHYTYSDNYNYVVESYFAVSSIRIDNGDVRGRLLINDEYDADIYLNDEYDHRWGIIKGSWGETLQQALDARNNVKANWNETNTSSAAYIQNKPTIPTVNNSTITLQANGATVDTFTTNASSAKTINLGNTLTSTTAGLKIEVVSALPASPDSNTIYIVQ